MKLIRYLTYDFVDLTLLVFWVIVLIKDILEKWYLVSLYILGANVFLILYTFGVIWRMGSAKDLMNSWITDEGARHALGMNIWVYRNRPIKRFWIDWVWLVLAISILVVGLLFAPTL